MVSSFDRASLAYVMIYETFYREYITNFTIVMFVKRSNYNNENTLVLIIPVNFAWNELLKQILLIFILYIQNKQEKISGRYNIQFLFTIQYIYIYSHFDHLYSHLYSHEPFRSLISIKYCLNSARGNLYRKWFNC